MDASLRYLISQGEPAVMVPVDATVSDEASFEAICLQVLPDLFPSSWVVPFTARIAWRGEGWRPDVAMIDKAFGYWYILEIETVSHSLEKHVLPQVRAFRDGTVSQEGASAIAEAIGLDVDVARTLIEYAPRYVGVVVNWPSPVWHQKLSEEGVQMLSIQVCKGGGRCGYVIEGLVCPGTRSLGIGVVLASSQVVRVKGGAVWKTGTYRISDDQGEDEWGCFVEEDVAWLSKQRGCITAGDRSYVQFLERADGSLVMRRL